MTVLKLKVFMDNFFQEIVKYLKIAKELRLRPKIKYL